MVQPDVMKIVMEEMADGCRSSFEECSLIMKGIGFKKKIPKEFWEDEEQAGLGIMDIYVRLSKSELKRIREEVISEICFRLHNDCYKCFTVEHYSNYLHGLAILEVPKDTKEIPGLGENTRRYNLAYQLWKLDDGSEEKWNTIADIARCQN